MSEIQRTFTEEALSREARAFLNAQQNVALVDMTYEQRERYMRDLGLFYHFVLTLFGK